MIKYCIGLLTFALVFTAPAVAADDPLFTDDAVITIRIDAPFSKLVRSARRSTDAFPATLTLTGAENETHTISLSPRGKSRRTEGLCQFPPLRVKFLEKPEKSSLFKGQKSLKLVTHCKKSERYESHILLEYSLYKAYNELTPHSLRVRLARIEYIDDERERSVATRYGFFIEDMDDAAKRNDMKEIDIERIDREYLNPESAARGALFGYMAGNLDFAMVLGPPGSNCCHNGKLMGSTKSSTQNLIYVPYDFDQTGLVDAPYATVPEKLRVRNVRQRLYRGYCIHNDAVRIEADRFLGLKGNIMNAIDAVPDIDVKSRKKAKSYLDEFFNTLGSEAAMSRNIYDDCRG